MLLVALVLGTITVLLARSFIQNQRAVAPASAPVVEAELATVVVAVLPMKFGDELTSEKLKVVSWPADIRPEGSFETIQDILGSERRVVLRSISRNEPVTKEKISGFGSRASLSQVIDAGNRAVAIRVNDVLSVGGFILPGDRVDVIHTYQAGDDRLDNISNIIIENLRVLGIDQLSDESQEAAVVGKTATLEVTPEQAQKLALSSVVGQLSLSLRRLNKDETEAHIASKTVEVKDLKPAEAEGQLVAEKTTGKTVYRRRTSKPKAKKRNPYGDMIITRGTEQSEEKVLLEEVIKLEQKTIKANSLAGAAPSP